jgi:hypothetical protein
MKTNSTAISALVALALTGCNIDSRTKVIRPADRPVAEVSAIAAMKGEQLSAATSRVVHLEAENKPMTGYSLLTLTADGRQVAQKHRVL